MFSPIAGIQPKRASASYTRFASAPTCQAIRFASQPLKPETKVPCYRYEPPTGRPGKPPSLDFVRQCKEAVAQLPLPVQEFLANSRFRYLFCDFNGDVITNRNLEIAYAFTSVPVNQMVVIAENYRDSATGERKSTLASLKDEGITLYNVVNHETGHALDHLLGRDEGLDMLSQDARLQALEYSEYLNAPEETREIIEKVIKPRDFHERFAELIAAMLGGGRLPAKLMLDTYPRLSAHIREELQARGVKLPT
jgi:hypothetical protein